MSNNVQLCPNDKFNCHNFRVEKLMTQFAIVHVCVCVSLPPKLCIKMWLFFPYKSRCTLIPLHAPNVQIKMVTKNHGSFVRSHNICLENKKIIIDDEPYGCCCYCHCFVIFVNHTPKISHSQRVRAYTKIHHARIHQSKTYRICVYTSREAF